MTVSIVQRRNNFIITVANVVMPASYATGGVAITPPTSWITCS